MSTTGNEFEEPGVNYPDGKDAGGVAADEQRAAPAGGAEPVVESDDTDHHGQDGGRDTLTVGQTQRAQTGQVTQDLPAMSQNNASDADKAAGIVAQTRQDVAHLGHERVVEVLRQRLEQTGVSLTDDEVDKLARQVLEGTGGAAQ